MYSVIVTLQVRQDECSAFEKLVQDLALSVRENEPGNLAYHILRSRAVPTTYRIVEIYASKEDFKRHLAREIVRDSNPKVQKALSAAPEMEVLEVVA